MAAGVAAAGGVVAARRIGGYGASRARGRVVIIGGGAAGLDVAARLCRTLQRADVTIVKPSTEHAYQPGWTLVASGVFPKEHFIRSESSLIPRRATWVRQHVTGIDPEHNTLTLEDGTDLGYDYLVVCPGHQLNYGKVAGIEGAVGHDGLYSNYTGDGATATWQGIQDLKRGVALFVDPTSPIKCGGAPQKIAYMADSYWRKAGVRDDIDVRYITGKAAIFSSPYYREALEAVMDEKGITRQTGRNLTAVDPSAKIATFTIVGGEHDGETETVHYDFLHFCPPQSSPDFIAASPLANKAGYVEVDKATLQHVTYSNVFGLGDASNLPTSKTGAAVRKQAPVAAHNLIKVMEGADLKTDSLEYHGYSSCPVVTGYGRMMLAEFDYSLKPTPTAPPWEHDSRKPTYANWLLKTRGLPILYWNAMLKGLA